MDECDWLTTDPTRSSGQLRQWQFSMFFYIQQSPRKNPDLHNPDYDNNFTLRTHASEMGIGTVLLQKTSGDQHPKGLLFTEILGLEISKTFPLM